MNKYPDRITECSRCAIAGQFSGPVPSAGPNKADIMYLGQNPGAEEDRKGEPFIGASGQWLNRIIKATGYARNEVRISNVVHCRTPENRVPDVEEVKNCLYWLSDEVVSVQPKLIVALGALAAQTLLALPPDTYVTEMRGQVYDCAFWPYIKVFVLLHPAVLVYSEERNLPAYTEDVVKLIQYLIDQGEIEPNGPNWKTNFKF